MHLRVWWKFEQEDSSWFNKKKKTEEGEGIVVCGDYDSFIVRTDEGELESVMKYVITKSEWVNHPTSGE